MAADIISVLNNLIEICEDGDKGFRTAAEDTENAELRPVFLKRAQDCSTASNELKKRVVELGGKPDEGGSLAGAVHRGWVNLKAAVSKRTDLAILEECERAEDVAKASYRKALEQDLPADVRTLVQRQCDGAIRNHDQIRDLRDQYRAKAS